ncbi:MAG: nitroreductase family protein [Nanoarchaeota archaeon]|nr:nitroreductase family protein [Nanoarchaeota archaeon]
MSDILEFLKSRRSIRKFIPNKPVDWDSVSRCIEAARHAPSSGNLQNWKFIVVLEPDLKKAVAEAALQQWWIAEAPVVIIAIAEPDRAERYYGVRGERLYSIQNCAAATLNIMLEAHSLGLGTAWVSAFDEDALKRVLSIEDFARPQAIIPLGYAAEIPPVPPKFPIEQLVYFNVWRNRIRDPASYMRDYSVVIAREIKKTKEALKGVAKKVKEKITGQENK